MKIFTDRRTPLVASMLIITLIYLATLQTFPNGSSDPYMIDVGETQIALNIWGTLHATGYPLYTILGNFFTPLPTLLGLSPAGAASLFSAWWTLLACYGLYILLERWTGKRWLAVGGIVLLALTRSVWIHSVIAEVYTMSLALLIGMWLAVLHPQWGLRKKVLALALLGGIGVSHHRALAFAAPGLIFALLPELIAQKKRLPRLLMEGVPLVLLGFIPYLYVILRAAADAEWVYSDSDTWDGFWFLFFGHEADHLITRPDSLQGWWDNLEGTLGILAREITAQGIVISLICLIIACWLSPQRRIAWMTTLSGAGFFLFAVAYHQAVLPEAIVMMAIPSLIVGVVLAVDWLWSRRAQFGWLGLAGIMFWAAMLYPFQIDFIQQLTDDRTGFASIEAASSVPRGALEQPVFMLPWGTRYFAASYSRLITRENADLRMVDHTADFAGLIAEGYTLYTEPDTFYVYPPAWWADRLGAVYLTSAGANLVRLSTEPRLVETPPLEIEVAAGIWIAGSELLCDDEQIVLAVGWYAQSKPDRDLSVFVHLTPADSPLPLAQADQSAPVQGWRPTSTWEAGELVTDHYTLPRLGGGEKIRFGMYAPLADGTFANYGETTLLVDECGTFLPQNGSN